MSNRQISIIFLPLWVIANTISLPVSLALLLIFSYSLNDAKPVAYVGLAVVGAVVGLAQWLVLRIKISRISGWWILTNIPGLYVCMFVSFVFAWYTIHLPLDKVFSWEFSLEIYVLVGIVSGAVGGAVGGAITGITQSLLLARRVLVRGLWIIWILRSTMAWAVGWPLGLVLGFGLTLSLGGERMSFVFGGIISGFLNGAITARVLIWAILKSRVSRQ